MLSLAAQDAELKEKFPSFTLVVNEPRRAIWEGYVTPRKRQYKLRIDYELPPHLVLNEPLWDYYPRVYVISPRLEKHYGFELGPIPHVWWDRCYDEQPNLCVMNPGKPEWNYDCSLADTTVPDVCEYLRFYEFWLVTKRWRGGGDNHQRRPRKIDAIEEISRNALSRAS